MQMSNFVYAKYNANKVKQGAIRLFTIVEIINGTLTLEQSLMDNISPESSE
jgi:hypothetical protein